MPLGQAAWSEVADIQAKNKFLFESLGIFQNLVAQTLQVDCQLDVSTRLVGEIDNYYTGIGLLHYSSSQLKGKNLLAIWLDHLALCADNLLTASESSRLITAREQVSLARMDPPQAKLLLTEYSSIFRQGAACPLPIFLETSYAWSQRSNPAEAMLEARKKWKRAFKNSPAGENEDPYIRLALQNEIVEPLQDPLFAELATRIFMPLLNHMNGS